MANGQDSFKDTAATTIASHTSTNISDDASNGGTWTVHGQFSPNTLQISNANRCKNGAASVNALVYHSAAAANDCSVKCVIHVFSNTGNVGVCGRISTGANTYYRAVFTNGTGWQLFKVNAGSQSQLGSTAGGTTLTVGNDVTLELKLSGSTISVIVDGTTLITATDSVITSGVSGIRMNGSTSDSAGYHIDNWQTVDATTTYTQTVSAASTCNASVIKQDQKAISAAVTCVALAVKLIQLIRSANTTSNAAVAKLAAIIRTASTTCSAAVASVKVKLLSLTAAVTCSASVRKSVGTVRSAATTTGATITKAVTAVRAAASTAIASCIKSIASPKSASVTTSASVTKTTSKTLAATVTCLAAVVALNSGQAAIGIVCGTLAVRVAYKTALVVRARYSGTLTKRKCQ